MYETCSPAAAAAAGGGSNDDGGRRKLLVGDVMDHVTCGLCAGYLTDATTVVTCLHSCKLID